MVNNNMIRDRVAEIQSKGKADKERWDKERANIQTQFLKELEGDTTKPSSKPTPANSTKPNSDEDAVIVESGGLDAEGSASKTGSTKKKKAKK